MSLELGERITGVGAVIVTGKSFLILQELRTKRSTNKLAGQWSIPMETVLHRERHRDAVSRLGREEVNLGLDLGMLRRKFLGWIELVPGVVLYNRLYLFSDRILAVIGSEATEVNGLRRSQFEPILDHVPRNGWLSPLRPGTYEGTLDAWQFLKDPDQFSPRFHPHHLLRDQIPEEMFDLVEQGSSVRVAASRLGLGVPPQLTLAA